MPQRDPAYAKMRMDRENARGHNPLARRATRLCKMAVPVLCMITTRMMGIRRRGRANALAIKVIERDFLLPKLPDGFEGFRILQISDTHANLDPAITDTLIQIIENLNYDLVIHTGDFHDRRTIDLVLAVNEWARLSKVLKAPAYGVFGNHDYIESAAAIEANGIHLLFNENVIIERNNDSIYLAGIDDASDICTDDIAGAASCIPKDHFALLLSHDPATYVEAESAGFQAMFSGHTHGGQICLPGGYPLIRNTRAPRHMLSGAWTYRELKGYTSRGAGCSGITMRYNCTPEVTIHTLRRG